MQQGLTYEAYVVAWKAATEQLLDGMDAQTRRSLLCRHCAMRAQRVTQGYRPSARLKQAFAILSRPQFWMVLRRTGALILRIVCPFLWQRHVSIRTFACASYAATSIWTLWIAPLRGAYGAFSSAFTVQGAKLFQWGCVRLKPKRCGVGKSDRGQRPLARTDTDCNGMKREVDAELAEILEKCQLS